MSDGIFYALAHIYNPWNKSQLFVKLEITWFYLEKGLVSLYMLHMLNLGVFQHLQQQYLDVRRPRFWHQGII